jgi:DNA-binding HxlR family transcriptional regulator
MGVLAVEEDQYAACPGKYECFVAVTVDVIGGKWKGVILHHLINGPLRFNELRRRIPSVSQRMLTLQLRELEMDGIIHRYIYQQIPPKVEYSLTEFGETLKPVVSAMRDWGECYEKNVILQRNTVLESENQES